MNRQQEEELNHTLNMIFVRFNDVDDSIKSIKHLIYFLSILTFINLSAILCTYGLEFIK